MTGQKLFQEMKITGLSLFSEKKLTEPRLFSGLKISHFPLCRPINFASSLRYVIGDYCKDDFGLGLRTNKCRRTPDLKFYRNLHLH